jgi:hypothetical protein
MALNKVPTLENFSWQVSVEDKHLTAPPVPPTKGQRYIIAATATGAWATHEKAIALYTGSTWEFIAPTEGFICWIKDENLFYKYDGSTWSSLTTASALFEIDLNGDLEPVTDVQDDNYYELDGNDDIMPKV